ncbi:maleylpyruvate isomerase family mycothiol-dependent enzyme [Actinomadura bangladeshensis]|uniref:Maleylpyruvate isomerase family mycothiol-dependent enzyme n=1 Tax=Actinomadura bangladeshensis TaxID=453573 RepID=A0A4R4NJB7_9ACTN|nr:maleylpyruvate isomerase family mycothiol-dependent enzyme [Actinomadura bangladeshensis]TDC07032.1 maleylpyruvate isomerase family mycothiol-dependent enzyme [Actinomadura bangladeshensis]
MTRTDGRAPHLGPMIDVRPLFAEQQAAFIDLLSGLDADEWERATVCPGWSVKDVAAHVLGDHAGRLSRHRDGFTAPGPLSGEPFPRFLDRINDEWVTAARRISPALLVGLLAEVGDQVVEFWQGVDLEALGGSVRWAGPEAHPVWLDAARDFTEYWTHHQQICDATGRPGLADPRYLGPVLDTFMRALPHTMRDVPADEGTVLQVVVSGFGGWVCGRGEERWSLRRGMESRPDALVEFDADTAWRLCTRGIEPDTAGERALITGDRVLAEAALQIVSIIHSGSARP